MQLKELISMVVVVFTLVAHGLVWLQAGLRQI